MGAQVQYGTGPSSTLLPGMIPRFDGREPQIISLLNNSRAAQVSTLQVTNTSYAVTLRKAPGTTTRTFTGSGFASASAAAADLQTTIDEDGIAGGWVSTSIVTDTITCTARIAGTGGDVTYSSTTNVTVVETTAASDGAAIGFGLAVMHDSTAYQGVRPTATAAVAQVETLTPTAVNSIDYQAGAQLSTGEIYGALYASDGSATVQEIVEALTTVLNAIFPTSTIAATENNTTLILTAEVAGTPFTSMIGAASSAVWTIAHTTANVTAGFTRPIAGFAVRSNYVGAVVDFSGGEGTPATEYAAGLDVPVMEAGVLVAETDDTVSRFDPVFVRITATGTEKVGSVRNDADGTDCILLAGARFLDAASGTSALHAPVRIQYDLSGMTA